MIKVTFLQQKTVLNYLFSAYHLALLCWDMAYKKHLAGLVVLAGPPTSIYRMDSTAQPTLKERIEPVRRAGKQLFLLMLISGPRPVPQQAIAVAQPQPQQVTPLLQRRVPEMEPAPEPQRGVSDGFMSMLDPVFTPIGNALGLSAKDVNEAHTPALIAGAYNGVSDIYLNTFGSFLTSILGATATLIAGTLAKDQDSI